MRKDLKDIADMLPEGLTEETVSMIASLVNNVIKEEVESRIKKLRQEAVAFVRANVDSLKEQAVRELELENPTYRNAKLFESVKAMMSLELTEEDENHAAIAIAESNRSLEESLEVLTGKLKEQITENKKLRSTVTAQSDKIKKLDEKIEVAKSNAKKLQEATKSLEEQTAKPFKSSEKAVVASEELENLSEKKETKGFGAHSANEFLTEDVMKYMPDEVSR